ncbi:cell wall-associated NlpC family hydrolase [Nocardia sp. GAS34]
MGAGGMTSLVTDDLPRVLQSLLNLYGTGTPTSGRAASIRDIAETAPGPANSGMDTYHDTRGMQRAAAESHARRDELVHQAVSESGAGTMNGRGRITDQISDFQARAQAIAACGNIRFGGPALLDAAQHAVTSATRQVNSDVTAAREQASRIAPPVTPASRIGGRKVVTSRRRRGSRGRRRGSAARTSLAPASDSTAGGEAVRAAGTWLGSPYVWGGGGFEGPSDGGFDCSGLTQYAIAHASGGHVILPRTTYEQIYSGVRVPLQDVRPGDLVFPASSFSARGPEHVQLAAGNGMVIEAPHSGASVTMSRMPSRAVVVRVL